MPDLATDKRVLVVGASGYFGQLFVLDLLENSDCKIVAASRSAKTLEQVEAPTYLESLRGTLGAEPIENYL